MFRSRLLSSVPRALPALWCAGGLVRPCVGVVGACDVRCLRPVVLSLSHLPFSGGWDALGSSVFFGLL